MKLSVVIPFDPSSAQAAGGLATELVGKSAEVVLIGEGAHGARPARGLKIIGDVSGKGRAIRQAVALVTGEITVLQDPDASYSTSSYPELTAPILAGSADAVFGSRVSSGRSRPLADFALSTFTNLVTDLSLSDPLSGQRAFRTEALRSVKLTSSDEEIDPEIIVKLAAQLYRFAEVPVDGPGYAPRPVLAQLQRARTLLRYATVQNDADNAHEGYNTLARMEGGAPNYNGWIGRRIREHCGARVLEIGAGIGTITAQLEPGRELVIALEVDPFYVERLKNRFRQHPHVRPYLSDVALADWEALNQERIDTIVLSNVLEHIPDDGQAVRRFGQILQPGGRLVILVPALPALFGSMDEAVGHHRRYTQASLRAVLEGNGFTLETLEWMNLAGIPGWFVNGRLLKRRSVPPLQLRLYDQVAPLLARVEARVGKLPIGMSLFAVAKVT